jgi:tetratricopeptide (TPR) repeat protein
MILRNAARFIAVLLVPITLSGCSWVRELRAKQAYLDGNKKYREENYKDAVPLYERALSFKPDMAAAHFYLASSHLALYRPDKSGEDNRAHIETALKEYQAALAQKNGKKESDKKLRRDTLMALISIHSDVPFKSFDDAHRYASELVDNDPNNLTNLFAMANLYEKFGKIAEAEATYLKARELNPDDIKACKALAAFYNKPNWDGNARFDDCMAVQEQCVALTPDDPTVYHTVAAFYWDKGYRDPMLSDAKKREYAQKCLDNTQKALELKPDYYEACVYENLCYRLMGYATSNARERQRLFDRADEIKSDCEKIRQRQQIEQKLEATEE